MSENSENLKEAMLFARLDSEKVQCNLCNFRCVIPQGECGRCRVRKNVGGTLYSLNYHKVCAAGADPIEKKPFFHFRPGSKTFSIAASGCNFKCRFCQNWQISQVKSEQDIQGQNLSPEKIVAMAIENKCKSVAYTYTEPTVFMEFAAACGREAKKAGLANLFVSNGYMTTKAIDSAGGWLDAINIDLKAFSDGYYKKLCGAKLRPVLESIEYVARHTDMWMEVTTLIVPGENDSDDELGAMAEFLVSKAGVDTPWHLSRFYPQYECRDSAATPAETLRRAYDIARRAGMKYVYIGNLPSAGTENTYCPGCGGLLIERDGFYVSQNNLDDGKCSDCGEKIAGCF
ncbi:MAG: AmmeMemoRadiSam system radical SAM enzyme [Anaerohalosphaeraceae bacterium]|nr:AmmeMemoRadiSam system radical SAM enzyme [Anaerohalosphaeraceae bacterium]